MNCGKPLDAGATFCASCGAARPAAAAEGPGGVILGGFVGLSLGVILAIANAILWTSFGLRGTGRSPTDVFVFLFELAFLTGMIVLLVLVARGRTGHSPFWNAALFMSAIILGGALSICTAISGFVVFGRG